MKKILKVIVINGLVLFSLGGPLLAQAQEAGKAPGVEESDPFEKRIPDFTFVDLPLEEISRELARVFSVNFVLAPGVGDIIVGRTDLRSVTLEDITVAIRVATGGKVEATKVNDRMVSFTVNDSSPPEPKPVCRAFSLAYYLSDYPGERINLGLQQVEEALQKCWSLLEVKEPPRLSLHAGTRLLIVAGKPEEVAVVEQVINELGKGKQWGGGEGAPVEAKAAGETRR